MKINHFIQRCICTLIALNIINIMVGMIRLHNISKQATTLCIAFTMGFCCYVLLPKKDKHFIHLIKNNLTNQQTFTFKKTPNLHKQMEYDSISVDISADEFRAKQTPYVNKIEMLKRQLADISERIDSQKAYRNQLSKQINELNIKYQQLNDLTSQHDQLVKSNQTLQSQKADLANAHVTDEYQSFKDYQSKHKLEAIDKYDGYQFETFTCDLLAGLGFTNIKRTQGSSDFGVDVYAVNGNTSYVFQCKLYSSPVGIKAVQEANSGRSYYNCKKAVVITNSYFTPHAISASEKLDIDLWNRDKLANLISESNV